MSHLKSGYQAKPVRHLAGKEVSFYLSGQLEHPFEPEPFND